MCCDCSRETYSRTVQELSSCNSMKETAKAEITLLVFSPPVASTVVGEETCSDLYGDSFSRNYTSHKRVVYAL